MRTLPLRIAPVHGEALDSWLEALSARMQIAWGDLLVGVGLPPGRSPGYTCGWLVELTTLQARSLSFATGTDAATLETMTLHHISRVLGQDSTLASESIDSMIWLAGRRSRFCPACLAENGGRWLLWWRLRWSFACLRHQSLLADACPVCQSPQRAAPTSADLVPTPGRCMQKLHGIHGRDVRRCGAELATARVVMLRPDHPTLEVQQNIAETITAGKATAGIYAGGPVTASAFIADLCALGRRILSYGSFEEIAGRTPRDLVDPLSTEAERIPITRRGVTADSPALASSVAATAAWSILQSESIGAAGERLRWLIESGRQKGLSVNATNIGWGRGISATLVAAQLSALSPFLSPSDQLRYRTHAEAPQRSRSARAIERARYLPSLLWPAVCLRVPCEGVGVAQLRSALAVAVVLVGSAVTLSEAAALLGSVTDARAVSRVLQRITRSDIAAQVLRAMTDLADHLDASPPPIDYARRRTLPCHNLLPKPTWNELCLSSGVGSGRGQRLQFARCWLYERLTGLPGSQSIWAVDSAEFRTKLANLPLLLTPEFHTAVDDYAQHHLEKHGIVGEPVTWSPVEFLAATGLLPLPVFELDLAEVHHVVASGSPYRSESAIRRSETDIEMLRYLWDTTPVRGSALRQAPGAHHGAAFSAARILPKALLVDLYLTQRLSLAAVAGRVSLSRQMVTRLTRAYGISLRPPGRPRILG